MLMYHMGVVLERALSVSWRELCRCHGEISVGVLERVLCVSCSAVRLSSCPASGQIGAV